MQRNYLIHMTHEGLPCWHILRAATLKGPLLERLTAGSQTDLSTYGTVLQSGWGRNVPADILMKYDV